MGKETIYYCDDCRKILSNEYALPVIMEAHIHVTGDLRLAQYGSGANPQITEIDGKWKETAILPLQCRESQYCIPCFLRKLQGTLLKNGLVNSFDCLR